MTSGSSAGEFSFTVELRAGRPECVAGGARWLPLAAALSAAWGTDGGLLADLLERRCGYDKEGAVGFNYAGDGPDEAPDGKVRVHYLDDRLTLEQGFFEEAARAFALAAMGLLKKAGSPVPAEIEARLRALGAGRSA